MNSTQKVAKNSIWLIIQPVILNLISIFVIGYIARTLGKEDYGKFLFAFTFVAMFAPIANMGLRPVMVRMIAENKDKISEFSGKILLARIFLGLFAFFLIVIIINLMNYASLTKTIVYIAGIGLIFCTIYTTFFDIFQGYEKMQYVAYTNLAFGTILTALSILVLFFGYRLIGLTLVYMFGSFLGVVVGGYFLFKNFIVPKLIIDFNFMKSNLIKGIPFFYPSLIAVIGAKIGIVILSKMSGDVSVGSYGAANNLVEKLIIIPDGICTAIFPTMAVLYQNSKLDAVRLIKKFFIYLLIIALPIAVAMTILAMPVINLIYGSEYKGSIIILQLLVWWLAVRFLVSIQHQSLGSIHKEKKVAMVYFITVPIFIFLSFIFVPHFGGIGVAMSRIITEIINFIMLFIFMGRYLTNNFLDKQIFFKVLIANIIMGGSLFLVKNYNLFLAICVGFLIYFFTIYKFRLITKYDLMKLKSMFLK